MKGSILDTTLIVIALFVLSLFIYIGYILLTNFTGSAIDGEIIQKGIASYSYFDYLPITMIVSAGIASLISGYYIKTHPLFFIISVIITIFIVIYSAGVANLFLAFADEAVVSTATAEFDLTVWVFQNLPLLILVVLGMGILGLYVFKNKEDRGI